MILFLSQEAYGAAIKVTSQVRMSRAAGPIANLHYSCRGIW